MSASSCASGSSSPSRSRRSKQREQVASRQLRAAARHLRPRSGAAHPPARDARRAGLPLEEALLAVSEQTEKPRLKSIILGVRAKVLEGHSLAVGLEEFPHAFPTSTAPRSRPASRPASSTRCSSGSRSTRNRGTGFGRRSLQAMVYPIVLTVIALLHRHRDAGVRRAEGRRGVRDHGPAAAVAHAGADRVSATSCSIGGS